MPTYAQKFASIGDFLKIFVWGKCLALIGEKGFSVKH